ncbi:MAG: hypothetical protein JNL80_01735 [Phycisphaerae bacterium]|jgi:hypothetical protein|nr:hypothetical protein [Phycisphaerae bacterium]
MSRLFSYPYGESRSNLNIVDCDGVLIKTSLGPDFSLAIANDFGSHLTGNGFFPGETVPAAWGAGTRLRIFLVRDQRDRVLVEEVTLTALESGLDVVRLPLSWQDYAKRIPNGRGLGRQVTTAFHAVSAAFDALPRPLRWSLVAVAGSALAKLVLGV